MNGSSNAKTTENGRDIINVEMVNDNHDNEVLKKSKLNFN